MRIKNLSPVFYERNKDGEVFYDVYARLIKDRIIFLHEEINAEVASVIVSLLFLLDKESSEEPITLYINSPGGALEACFAIYDVMQLIKAPVHTVCIGEASSAAAILLAAGSKGGRFATTNARIMIHQVQIEGVEGSATDLANVAKETKLLNKRIIELLARHVSQPYSRVLSDCEVDKYMSAEESKIYGIIDEILMPTKEIPELKTKKRKAKKEKAVKEEPNS